MWGPDLNHIAICPLQVGILVRTVSPGTNIAISSTKEYMAGMESHCHFNLYFSPNKLAYTLILLFHSLEIERRTNSAPSYITQYHQTRTIKYNSFGVKGFENVNFHNIVCSNTICFTLRETFVYALLHCIFWGWTFEASYLITNSKVKWIWIYNCSYSCCEMQKPTGQREFNA